MSLQTEAKLYFYERNLFLVLLSVICPSKLSALLMEMSIVLEVQQVSQQFHRSRNSTNMGHKAHKDTEKSWPLGLAHFYASNGPECQSLSLKNKEEITDC